MLDFITGLLGTILYPLFSIIFILVDILQAIFRTFAGVGGAGYGDTLWNIQNITSGNSGTETDTGLVFFLLNTPLVKNMLISIMMLGLFLLIIFTVMAFIKNAYSAKQKGWKEIIGNAIKGLANFIFLPVCCLLGIWLGNILLNAIDGATSTGGSTLMSRKLFIAAAYNANLYRNGKADDTDSKRVLQWVYDYAKGANIITVGDIPVTQADIDATQTNEERAELVDRIYASGAMNIYTHDGAGQGYSLYQINYLTLIIGGVFMLYVLISLAYGMIRRMFILLMLYIISPALCAMYPLDEGKAAGSWKSDFIKQTISAYGAVAGMNLFFSLLPLVNNIQLFGYRHVDTSTFNSGATDVLTNILVAVNNFIGIDTIIQLLIMVSGLFVVKEFIAMISGYIGAEDAYSKGASLRSTAKTTMKDKFKDAGKKTGAFVGNTVRLGKKAGDIISSQKDRIYANKEKGLTGARAIFGNMAGWTFATSADDKKEAHKGRIEQLSLNQKDERELDLAKELYKKQRKKGDPSWNKLSEKDQRRYLGAARFNDRREDAIYAKKQGKVYRDMSETEKQEIHNERLAEERKHQGFGSETVKGKVARGVGGALGDVGKTLLGDAWKEATSAYKENYTDKLATEGKKEASSKKGKYGEKEALSDISNLLDGADGLGVVLKGATSEALMAMSNGLFKDKVFADAKKGKINGFDFESIGLNAKTATIEQVNELDRNVSSIMNQAERIDSAATSGSTELAKELTSNLLDKLTNLDTNGNEKLEEAVRNAMNSLSKIKTSSDPADIKKFADELNKTMQPLNNASLANAKAIQKYIEKASKEIVKAIEDDERRSGSKK